MRLPGGVVFLTVFACCFPTLVLGVEPSISLRDSSSTARLVVEGRVLEREIRTSDDHSGIEYLFYIEQIGEDVRNSEVLVARTSMSRMLGSLIEGKDVVLVLEPLSDGTYRLIDAEIASSASLSASTQAFPGAEPEHLVDGLMDLPGSSWAAAGSPNWVEIDLGQPHLITEISVAPFIGSPGNPYFYNQEWAVQYRDNLGELRDFSNVQLLLGAGTLVGTGISITDGDPGTTSSVDGYKYYGFRFEPVSTRYVRYTVASGDRDGDSNGAELEIRQAFLVGTPVTLDGSASDAEDGDLSPSITWSSDRDGTFGTGSSVTVNTLSIGTHTVTALIEDSNGAQSTSTTQVTVVDSLPVTYSMTTATTGTGGGTISSSPAGIDCGSDCSETFDEGTAVTLTATSDPDSSFVGWSGHADCSDGQIAMVGDRSCTATFDLLPPVTHTLTTTKAGDGAGTVTSSPTGINCGADCTQSFDDGTVVTLAATPNPGSTLVGFSGHADCSDGVITLTSDRTCIATFELMSFPLTTITSGSGSGSVTSTPAGIDCGSDCSHDFDYNTTVSLTATPSTGSTFAGWSGHADCSDGSVRTDSAKSCTASFDLQTFSLTTAKAGTGAGTVTSSPAGIDCGSDCGESFDYGTTVGLIATPASGSAFAGWTGSGDCNDGSLTMTDNRNCTAIFDLLPPATFGLSIEKVGTGTGLVTSSPTGISCGADCDRTFVDGTIVTLSVTPSANSTFVQWSGDPDCADGQVTMNLPHTCTAQFDIKTYNLAVSIGGLGSGTVTSTPNGIDCGVDCDQLFSHGTMVDLSVAPATDSAFSGWSGDSDCADGSIAMTQGVTCTANFDLLPPETYTLTVAKTGSGSGSVTSSPAGISCGADCNETYEDGTIITLTAASNNGSSFVGWSGHSDCADGQITLTSDKTCSAEFELQTFPLTIATNGSGTGTVTSSPAGIDCGADCSGDFDFGTVVTLNAAPATGSTFAGWNGPADCSDGSITLDAAKTCTATFTLETRALTVTRTGAGSGTVTSSPAGIDCGADCDEDYDYGTAVTLSATPDTSSSFVGWSGDSDCSDGSVTMTQAHSCTASFELLPPDTYSLTVTKTGTGSGTITSSPAGIDCGSDCNETYDDGTVITFTATPTTGSTFTGWTGHSDCADGQITLTSDRTCSAEFELQTFPLTIATNGSGAGTVTSSPAGIDCGADCSQDFDFGTVVTLNAAPATGSTFAGWSGPADCSDGSITLDAAKTCTATFTLETRALTVTRTGAGSGAVTSTPAGIDCGADCGEDFDFGTVVTLNASPTAGSTFAAWSGHSDCADGQITLTSDRTCSAEFELQTFPLTIATNGTGAGTVTSSPAGIDCGADCAQDFDYGTVVTLNASPTTGSTFTGWSGPADCSDGSVTMTQAHSCTATFELLPPDTYSLTIAKAGIGSGSVASSPAGISCGVDCSETYEDGTVVVLTASPATGSSFSGWTGHSDCADGSVTVTSDLTCTATFTLESRALVVTKSGTGSGTITSSPAGIDCGADCDEDYDYGTAVTLSATPDTSSSFVGWSGDSDCSDGSVTMTQAHSCTASFELLPPDTYSLTVTKTGTGAGNITSSPAGISCGSDCNETYDDGTVITFTATPTTGSTFTGWTGHSDCADGQITLTSDRTCSAEFELQTFALSIATNGTGAGTVTSSPAGIDCGADCNQDFDFGTVVTLSATSDTNSSFVGWTGGADCSDGSVTMTQAHSCTASFEPLPPDTFVLTINQDGNGTGTVTSAPAGIDCGADCSQEYEENTVVTLNATPDGNSTFTGWGGPNECRDGQLTISRNITCTASFDLLPPDTFSLTVATIGTGSGMVTSSPTGINCGSDCNETYEDGTLVTLTATPLTGSTFGGWTGPGDCSDGSVSVTSDLTCTATFTLESRSLLVAKSGTGSGTITSSPSGIDCGADCGEDYDFGTVVTLDASPTAGSTFTGWSGDSDCADGSIAMTQGVTCTANFDLLPPDTYSLAVAKTGTGSGSITSSPAGIDCGIDCNETYEDGTVVVLTASPATGSSFSGWTGPGDCSDGSVTVTADLICSATFTLESRALVVSKSGTGSGTITSSPAGIDCGADCDEDYDYGTAVTLSATPDTSSSFVGWSGDSDCSDGSVTMTQAHSCTASFDLLPPDTYSLTVTKTGTGSGTITSSPAGIDCGSDCNETYDDGTLVTLTATSLIGSTFVGWSGHSDCADGQITLTSDRTCSAEFELQTYPLTIATNGSGAGTVTSSPAGIDCGVDCSQDFDFGTVVTLNAAPATGSTFAGWSGPADCSDGSITLDAAKTCTATFALETRALTVTRTGAGSGTVASTPAGIDCGADCNQDFDYGTAVTLSATPDPSSSFVGWTGDPDCSDGSVNMTQAHSCTATFELLPPDTYSLTIAKAGIGSGSVASSPAGISCGVDCSETYKDGTVVVLTASPATGSSFSGWTGPGDCADGSVTVTSDLTCTATFTLESRALVVNKSGTGSGTITSSPAGIDCGSDCAQDFDYGTDVILSATPSTGSTFTGWSRSADCTDGSVRMTQPQSCTAVFDLVPPPTFALTVFKTGTGNGTVTSSPTGIDCGSDCQEFFVEDTIVTLTSEPAATSLFAGWSGDPDCADGVVTIDATRTCTATFDLAPPNSSPSIDLTSPTINPAVRRPVLSSGNEFPDRDAEKVVDGLWDIPDSAWAANGAPNWVEIDLGEERMLDQVSVAPFIGSPGTTYYYDESWMVQYRDTSGALQDFSNVAKVTGAGTLAGPGIRVTDGDPGTATSNEAYKLYDLSFEPVALQYLRFTVTEGDVDNDSNAAEIGVRQVWEQGTSITFSATATDAEDGDLSTDISWSSDIDGHLGTGETLTISNLTIGEHSIQAQITDSQGSTSSHLLMVKVIPGTVPFYSLSVDVDGFGKVTSAPAGIDCGNDCDEAYLENTEVSLTATPDAGWRFVDWGGDTDCTDGSVIMSAERSCSAVFELISPTTHTLTISTSGSGTGTVTSSPSGIDCGNDCSELYAEGTPVTLTATPAAGSVFVGWSGAQDCNDGRITLNANRTCDAEFSLQGPEIFLDGFESGNLSTWKSTGQ